MVESIYKKIDFFVENITKIHGNPEIINGNPDAARNLLLSFSIASLYKEFHINGGSFQEIHDAISFDFPFPQGLKIEDEDIKKVLDLSKEAGEILPAVIFEYFLENGGGRKKRGVYYTPSRVVEDIVRNTVSPILDKKISAFKKAADCGDKGGFSAEWEKLANFKVFDPACGWGAFLVEAFECFQKFYNKIGEISQNFADSEIIKECRNPGKKIIDSNLFGLDINRDSVMLTSHILKALSGLPADYKIKNVKTADFINWMENPEISPDAVIGNPPYFTIGGGGKGRIKTDYHDILKNHPVFAEFFRSQSDIFYYFVIGSIKIVPEGGKVSFIVPSYWLDNEYADFLRGNLSSKCIIEEIIDFSPCPVFRTADGANVGVDTLIFRAKKGEGGSTGNRFPVYSAKNQASAFEFLNEIRSKNGSPVKIEVDQRNLAGGKWAFSTSIKNFSFLIKDGKKIHPLGRISTVEAAKFPGEFENRQKEMPGICDMGQGQETGLSSVFVVKKSVAEKLGLEPALLKPNVKNRHIKKWIIEPSDEVIIMTRNEDDIEIHPNIKKYLEIHRGELEMRQRFTKGKRKWFAVSIPQSYELFSENPKIIVPYRAQENRFALDLNGYYNDGGDVRAIAIKPEWKEKVSYYYLLALLNSKPISIWYREAGKKKGNMLEFFTRPMSRIPVILPEMEVQEEIGKDVREILYLCKEDRNIYSGRIKTIERKIDDKINKLGYLHS